MEFVIVVGIVALMVWSVICVWLGKKLGANSGDGQKTALERQRADELQKRLDESLAMVARHTEEIKKLTSERDVHKNEVEGLAHQLEQAKAHAEQSLKQEAERYAQMVQDLKESHSKQLDETKSAFAKQLDQTKAHAEKSLKQEADCHAQMVKDLKESYLKQMDETKSTFAKQLAQIKENSETQVKTLREMNDKQVEAQLNLIRQEMKATSESVLKARQQELGERNQEQVSKIVDPLQKSLKDMQEALNNSKRAQNEAIVRLDTVIRESIEKSASLGETADRLTRALTGEVKVQGNFGELKLKQLLEDLELKEGEQFDTQETLHDKYGKQAKGDDGKGLIPDFILHFPNNRHVVVDSKMSLTDYERYMNAPDGTSEKSAYLKAHIDSVKMQVKRLAKKEYSKYLPEGYNRLSFAIMYIPIEGALNLALFNDASLWREAYDQGVMILGPQTMYMNLRVLEMMWTQVRQLKNQQAMMDAANILIDRVQDFGIRFIDVESSMNDTLSKMGKLKITTAESGPSIITAARNLLKAGAKENKKKKSLQELDNSVFIESDSALAIAPPTAKK